MNNQLFEHNRAAWNEALEYHQKARGRSLHIGFQNVAFTTFDRDCDAELIAMLKKIDLTNKVIAQMPCNNGRELLSLMRFGAKQAVGFDISDAAIEEAKNLAETAKLDVAFERTNILEIDDTYNNFFDFIYISEGSLQWFPDLHAYFSVVSRLLKKNGNVLIFEMHPFAYFFENGFNAENPSFDDLTPYFEKGPYTYQSGLDYIGGVEYEAKACYWFMHKLSDITKALIQSGISIDDFEEYNFDMANNTAAQIFDKFPLSYILTGKKN